MAPIRSTILIAILLAGASCQTSSRESSGLKGQQKKQSGPVQTLKFNNTCDNSVTAQRDLKNQSILVMTQNVENLFDYSHDVNKHDWEYQPVSETKVAMCEKHSSPSFVDKCKSRDWDSDKYEMKLQQLEKLFDITFKRVGIPDIIVLTEIENQYTAYELGKRIGFLNDQLIPQPQNTSAARYSLLKSKGSLPCEQRNIPGLVLTNNPDSRGIDIAILYDTKKFKLKGCMEHVIENERDKEGGRNIIEAILKHNVSNKDFVVYGNHWPSQFAKIENGHNPRAAAAKMLKKLMNNIQRHYPHATLVASGDFNVIDVDLKDTVDYMISGNDKIFDAHLLAAKGQPKTEAATYYFAPKVAWNVFDRFFVKLGSGVKHNPASYRIHNFSEVSTTKSTRVFRNLELGQNYFKQRNEKAPRYIDTVDRVVSPAVQERFKKDKKLELLEVEQPCAPKRIYIKDGTIEGFSDHYGTSIKLHW